MSMCFFTSPSDSRQPATLLNPTPEGTKTDCFFFTFNVHPVYASHRQVLIVLLLKALRITLVIRV